ncbi:MAG: GNAT family N-acetyltransferase [Alphaproteobacteria bacterium]
MAHSEPEIGRLALADLADAEALVAEAGWNQAGADWRMFLDFGTAYAVRERGRAIATATWLPYQRCAWISMVLVAAGERRRGLATSLLHRCIADVSAAGLVPVLDATPAGAKVYAPLGFKEAWGFTRLASERRAMPLPVMPAAIEPITDAIWPALCAYDTAVFGNDRSKILARLRGRLPPANLVAQRAGRIVGLLLGRGGRTASHLGPLIAEDDEVAKALLARALSQIGSTIYLDVADAKTGVRSWLEAAGFSVQRPFTRMLLGRDESFDDTVRTYAVIGPEFG